MPKHPIIDFDHFSPEYAASWPEMIDTMHGTCPVAWSEAYGGFWVLGHYESVRRAAEDYETFSSHNDIANERRGSKGILIPPAPYQLTLNEEDPPLSTKYRALEAPFFTPKYLSRWAAVAQEHTDACVDAFIAKGTADIIHDLAMPVPAKTTLHIVGIPAEDWAAFALPAHKLAYTPASHPEYPFEAVQDLMRRLGELYEDRKANPRDDVASRLAHGKVEGRPLPKEIAVGMLIALVTGGFDTTTALIANALYWLEDQPEARDRIIADQAALDNAVEEFLRAFPPTHGTARNVVRDIELCGQTLHDGERVMLSWAAANYDPTKFECPHEVRIDRPNAREHVAFGGGFHRCLGAPLAKIEIKIVIRTILQRIPDYRIDRAAVRRYPTAGLINGYLTMPMTFAPR